VTSHITDAIKKDRYHLLSPGAGPADLFYLPVRTMRVLSWSATNLMCCKWVGREGAASSAVVRELCKHLLDEYVESLVAVSDEQAPYVLTSTRGLSEVAPELVDVVLKRLFASSVARRGNVLRVRADPEAVMGYLLACAGGPFEGVPVARPNHLVVALLRAARGRGLWESWDLELERLDGLHLGAFIPESLEVFGDLLVQQGATDVTRIGHGTWTCEAISNHVDQLVAARSSNYRLDDSTVVAAACVAAEALPDRVPYFIMPWSDASPVSSPGT
jgi:hypothetical protein